VQTLRSERGRLLVAAAGWGDAQLQQFRDRLRAGGLQAERTGDGTVVVSRAAAGVLP
jgi:hypothetical protein